jgi:hypothetical protein
MGARRQPWFRASLVVVQVTLSFILLVGTTLLMQSLRKIRTTSPGFSTTRVLDTWIPLTAAGYDVPRAKIFQDELIQRVRALPGVEAAAYARVVPLGYESYAGIALALLLTRLLGNLLYQVSPRDPLAFAAAFAVMTVASVAACFLPAWRATRTDPIRALRAE